MAAAKLVSLLLLFVFTTGIFSDAGEEPTSASEIQLDQLNAKIRALESQIDEKSREVKGREELVAVKDNLLHERQDKLSSLETQLSSLRKKGSSDSVEVLEKAKARATELEKQVEVLRNFLEQKNKEKESTEARRSEAEKKLNELNSRLEKLHKTKEEQKGKIRKLERALKISEEEMLRMRHEAATKARELQVTHSTMKSLIIFVVALLCIIVSPTTTMGGWPKPSEVSNEEKLVNTGQAQPHLYAGKLHFGDSKVWKCTYNNGSGAAISISYPSPPQPPSQKPPTPSSPLTPKMAPPLPKPSPPRPSPKKSPPPPNPSLPPPPPPPPPPPKPSSPPPKPSPPPPKPSPPPTPKMSPPSPTPSPPRPTPKTFTPPPNPSSLTPNESPPPAKTSILIIHSPPPPHEPIPAQSPPKEPTTPSTQWPPYRNWNPLGHFINCITEFGPSAVCKQQIEVSYYTGRFRVSDYCCNLFVNMRNECSDVILGFYDDRYFLPLLRCTCHVKIY